MATIIATPAASLLSKVGAGIAGALGKWIFGKGLAIATGDSSSDQIKDDIANILTDVHQIQISVDQLSHQLSDSLLQLRQDDLKESITKINTYYNDIGDIMQTAFDLPSQNLTQAEQDGETKKLQSRLNNRLRACADDVPGILDRINDFLSETGSESFLHQTAQHAFDDSKDFLAYYSKSKVMVLSYWVAVVKGISLLQMAHDSKDVTFPEGQRAIDRETDNYLAQEKNFQDIIGMATINLAQEVLKDTNAEIDITWTNSRNQWMQVGDGSYYAVMVFDTEPEPKPWFITSYAHDRNIDRPVVDPIKGYRASLCQRVGNPAWGWLIRGGSQYEIEVAFGTSLSSWYIKPLSPGADKFSFRFQSNWYGNNMDGDYIISTKETLMSRGSLDANNPDMAFTVAPLELAAV